MLNYIQKFYKVSTLAHFLIPVNYWNRPQTVELDNSWELNLASHNECLRAKRIQQPIRIIASEIEPSEIAVEIKGSSNIPIFFTWMPHSKLKTILKNQTKNTYVGS